MTFDVVIAGSGAAGLTAAITAAKAGLRVLVVEKAAWFGGTTAWSGGGLWIPRNHHQAAAGLSDDLERAETYLKAVLGNYFEPEKIGAFLQHAPDMLAFIEANSDVRTVTTAGIDYQPWLEGAAFGRTLIVPAYNNTRLKTWRAKLRPQMKSLTEFGGMQIGIEDIAHFVSIRRSAKSFRYSAGKLFSHLLGKLAHGGAVRSVNGNALAAELLKGAVDSGVTLWRSSAVVALSQTDGRVDGVVVRRDGKDESVTATRAVILATGGYGANAAMRADNLPLVHKGASLQPIENQGDGIALGTKAGGRLVGDNKANAIWIPVSRMRLRDGSTKTFPHMYERHKPGFILVDASGRRFVNEGVSYQALGEVMHAAGIERAFLIGDHRAVRNHGMGFAKPWPMPLRRYIGAHYIRKGASLAALAEQLGIDATALTQTVADYNAHAVSGGDPVFHRGEDVYSAAMGDPTHSPNPAVGPLDVAPFYGLEIQCGDLSTVNGLATDASARVLGADGAPIAGLYAVGVDSNSIFRGTYPGAGASLGPGMTFGYIAARHAAGALTPDLVEQR